MTVFLSAGGAAIAAELLLLWSVVVGIHRDDREWERQRARLQRLDRPSSPAPARSGYLGLGAIAATATASAPARLAFAPGTVWRVDHPLDVQHLESVHGALLARSGWAAETAAAR